MINPKILSEQETLNVLYVKCFILLFSNIVDQVRIFNNNLIMNSREVYRRSFVERKFGSI